MTSDRSEIVPVADEVARLGFILTSIDTSDIVTIGGREMVGVSRVTMRTRTAPTITIEVMGADGSLRPSDIADVLREQALDELATTEVPR